VLTLDVAAAAAAADEDFWASKGAANLGVVRGRAQAGQGQSIALARNVMRQTVGEVCAVKDH
jgi:hypothetical protein